jgi:hypothetical protein
MSIYDHRDKPAYGLFKTEPHYSKNKHILEWWTSEHDELLRTQIVRWQWVWYWGITDQIVKITPSATIESWKKADLLCSKYAWYNILMYFAAARAEKLGLTKGIRRPQMKTCLLCERRFVEDSLPMPLIERLGIDKLEFCAPCLRDTVLQGSGNDSASERDMLKYLQDLANLIERVPPQNFGEGMTDLLDMQSNERLALLKLLRGKPSVKRVKAVFGSWLNALIQAGVLEDRTRKTSRGIQCIARDGHICLSLGEKTIDDFLHVHGVRHEKEPRYPEGNYRGDFKVGSVFIEYFGLTGNPEYDAKTEEKIRICRKHGINLVAIYPVDLISQKKLEGKLSVFIQKD